MDFIKNADIHPTDGVRTKDVKTGALGWSRLIGYLDSYPVYEALPMTRPINDDGTERSYHDAKHPDCGKVWILNKLDDRMAETLARQ